jgi:hypothetical protein
MIVQPNNPDGPAFAAQRLLLAWHAELEARGGWLIVDEAFGDMARPRPVPLAGTDLPRPCGAALGGQVLRPGRGAGRLCLCRTADLSARLAAGSARGPCRARLAQVTAAALA